MTVRMLRMLGCFLTVRMFDLQSRGCKFDSRYQVVTVWMGDCLRIGKPSQYITNTNVKLSTRPSTPPG